MTEFILIILAFCTSLFANFITNIYVKIKHLEFPKNKGKSYILFIIYILSCLQLYIKLGLCYEFFIYICLFFTLLTISLIDFHIKTVPQSMVIFILMLGIINIIINPPSFMSYLLGFFIISVPLLIIAIITNGIGGGDIKLFAAIGLLLGFKLTLIAGFFSFIVAGIFCIFILAKYRIKNTTNPNKELPFVPFILIGTSLSILYGNEFIIWYLRKLYV